MFYVYLEDDGPVLTREDRENVECVGCSRDYIKALRMFEQFAGELISGDVDAPVQYDGYEEDDENWFYGGL